MIIPFRGAPQTDSVCYNRRVLESANTTKRALITGVTGQDGALLADLLRGDFSKARRELGWHPETTFADLTREMVDADIAAEKRADYRREQERGARE